MREVQCGPDLNIKVAATDGKEEEASVLRTKTLNRLGDKRGSHRSQGKKDENDSEQSAGLLQERELPDGKVLDEDTDHDKGKSLLLEQSFQVIK